MKVKELIEELQELPQELEVMQVVGKTADLVHEATIYNGGVWVEGNRKEKVVLLR